MEPRIPRITATLLWCALGVGQIAAAQAPTDVAADLDRPIAPRSGVPCPDPGLYSLSRPDPEQPTIVGLGVYFQDVSVLSDVDQTLDADLYIVVRWRDSRLADASRGDGSADCPMPTGKLWTPALEPENLRGRQTFYPDRFLVDARGVATLARRLLVKVAYPLDLHRFPLDRHDWVITLWPVLSRADEVRFRPLARFTGRNERLSIQGWRVGVPRAEASETSRPQHIGTYARYDLTLDLERDWTYHAWKLGLPLALIVLMAYGVYFIPPSAVAQQIGLSMTSMLTLIAYMLTLGNTLPRIAYLTLADRMFIGSAMLVFVGLIKAVATLAAAQGPHASRVDQVHGWGRWAYPFGVLAIFLVAFLF